MTASQKIKVGLEVFLKKHLDIVKSKRVGLITNPSGVDSHCMGTISLFANTLGIDLVALFGPEHGVRADAQAGQYVAYEIEKELNIPVFSLYGQAQMLEAAESMDLDESMRSFDTVDEGKLIEPSMIENIEVLVFDIQDVGTRIYTYIATMAYAMQACVQYNKEFIVLDRPNPINGIDMEGPVLEYPAYSSFVGLYPIPVRHGMTVGELARLFNTNFLPKKANLTVIPMRGWERSMWFDDTGLPWIPPSPNMPTLDTAIVYPGQVFLEGTNVSEGRGTETPFEIFGAPWIDGAQLARALNSLELSGVAFREACFTPQFSKYRGQVCEGTKICVRNRARFKPFETSMHIIQTVMGTHAEKFRFHPEYFDRIMGNANVREALKAVQPVSEIVHRASSDLDDFKAVRKSHLLY